MKRIYTLLIMLLLVCTGAWAYDVTFSNEDAKLDERTSLSSNHVLTSLEASGIEGVTITDAANTVDRATNWSYRCFTVQPTAQNVVDVLTITAPEGYVIISYELSARAYSSNQSYSITANEGTGVTSLSGIVGSASKSMAVTDIYSRTATLNITQVNSNHANYLNFTKFIVVLGRLDNTMSSTKKYVINCQRGTLPANGSSLTTYNNLLCSTMSGSRGSAKEFAIVEHNGFKYLYSVSDLKYIAASDRRLTSVPASSFTTVSTGNDNYPIRMKLNGLDIVTTLWKSQSEPTGYTDGIKLTSGNNDEGIRYCFYETGSFDASSLISSLDAFSASEVTLSVNKQQGDFFRNSNVNNDGTQNNSIWCNKWISSVPEAPVVTLSQTSMMMTPSGNDKVDIRQGTWTISVPEGFAITGYRLTITTTAANTVTSADGVATAIPANTEIVKEVTGLFNNKTTFIIANNSSLPADFQITVKRLSTISSLSSINRNKSYAIVSASRGGFAVAAGGSQLTRTMAPSLNIAHEVSDVKQKFAFVYHDDSDDGIDNGLYYLYSVSEKKFLSAVGTADDNVVNLAKLATQSVSFLETGVSGYPVCIEMSNTADLNIRNDEYEPGVVIYGTNGNHKTDGGNALRIYELDSFDPSEAESTWNVTDVTYNLYYDNNKVDELFVENEHLGEAIIPSSLDNGLMTYTYTPSTITNETTMVRIDATWNGPFEISPALSEGNFASGTKWYVVDIHSNENDYTWQYDATSKEIQTPVIAKDAFENLGDANLFCFVGNPYDGFKIYNKAAGSTYTLRKENNDNTVSYMSTTDDRNNFKVYASTSIISSSYCFKLDGDDYYLNQQTNSGVNKLCGWYARDEGSSCRFLSEGKYYLTYLNSLPLNIPAGAVGTKEIINEETRSLLIGLKNNLAGNVRYLETLSLVESDESKSVVNSVKTSSDIVTLTDGYYHIVSAYTAFPEKQNGKRPKIYYDSANDKLKWAIHGANGNKVDSLFLFTSTGSADVYTIKSLNAGKYIQTAPSTEKNSSVDMGGLTSNNPANVTVTSLGSCQYKLNVEGNEYYLHPNSHNSGSGLGNILIPWDAAVDQASAWYIVKVSGFPIKLHEIDEFAFATTCLPFDVTISNADAYTMVKRGDWLVPTQLEGNEVPAGTPVLLKNRPAINGTTAYATINTGAAFSTSNVNALQGTYVPKDFALTEGATADYFLGVYSGAVGFYRVGIAADNYTLGSNKAYLPASAGARGFAINWDDEVTGIGDATQLKQKTENRKQVFDLQGRRVENPQRGLYIVNGRKVVVK